MINSKSLDNEMLYDLMQEYRKKFKKPAFMVKMPSGTTDFPNSTTEDELIEALRRCLNENIELTQIYPSLINDDNPSVGVKI